MFHLNRRPVGRDLIHRLSLSDIKLTGIKAPPQDGVSAEGPRMLGQWFQGIIPGLSNHFEIAGLLPTKDSADTTKEIAHNVMGSDTSAVDRSDDTYHTHAGAANVDGGDKDRILFWGHAVSLFDGGGLESIYRSQRTLMRPLCWTGHQPATWLAIRSGPFLCC
ncbi:protein of unknown function [Acidithiobacillus ferrivorans]|uniref:Uncharacterized protein n=1 Tax=Acidithiobacillus ferrivorans TaxID=160808 RepID=A0ABY1MT60_9PROT|nr:protein of unknown function [Acidithiobacillus ferrivorans]